MKNFQDLVFNPAVCREQLLDLKELLSTHSELGERHQILPFFRERMQLSAFLASYAPDVFPPDKICYEYPIFGDFTADLVLANNHSRTICLIEFEDAKSNSIFSKVQGKATTEWGKRFEHGFSQLVDWFRAMDDLSNTERFVDDFGFGISRFFGFLLIGRSHFLEDKDRRRLRWRTNKVLVDSNQILCFTFDDVYENLSLRMKYFSPPDALVSE